MKIVDNSCFLLIVILIFFSTILSSFTYFCYNYLKLDSKVDSKFLENQTFGHRGCILKDIPENSIKSIEYVSNKGYGGIEFDIHVTKDDKIIVIHDNNLDRVSKRMKPFPKELSSFISELNYEEIEKFFIYEKGSLELLLNFLKKSNEINSKLKWMIEVKEYKKSNIIIEFFKNLGKEIPYFHLKTTISSYNPLVLYQIKKLIPNLSTTLNINRNLMTEWFGKHKSSLPNTILNLNFVLLNFIKSFSFLIDYFIYISSKTWIPSFIGLDMICVNKKDLNDLLFLKDRGYILCSFSNQGNNLTLIKDF